MTLNAAAPRTHLLTEATPKALILNIYGAHVRRLGGWLSVAHLLRLMDDLGHDAQPVRAAISRMKRADLLAAERRGRAAGYALTPLAMEVLADGDARIFHAAAAASLADGWVIAVFSVPEETRERRHRLRSQLVRLGFGQVTSGVWIAPRRMHAELQRILARTQLVEHLTVFGGAHLGFTQVDEMAGRAWDLKALEERYRAFLDDHQGPAALARTGASRGRDAFILYMDLLASWRRLAYLDPGLPGELLPERWSGHRARQLFTRRRRQLDALAQAHVEAVAAG